MKARVSVTLKAGVLDPQGKAIEGALAAMGIAGIASVRQGKLFDIELAGADATQAAAGLREACERLLANTVIENYAVELVGAGAGAPPPDAARAAHEAAEAAEMPAEGHP